MSSNSPLPGERLKNDEWLWLCVVDIGDDIEEEQVFVENYNLCFAPLGEIMNTPPEDLTPAHFPSIEAASQFAEFVVFPSVKKPLTIGKHQETGDFVISVRKSHFPTLAQDEWLPVRVMLDGEAYNLADIREAEEIAEVATAKVRGELH